jgi:hypothetical protein
MPLLLVLRRLHGPASPPQQLLARLPLQASGLAYSKTSVFLTDRTLAPHLELEVTDMTQLGLPGICFWLSLDPRLPLVSSRGRRQQQCAVQH